MKTTNPFLSSKKHIPKYFCDREEETKILINEISECRNVFISAEKGLGKTKLLKHLYYILSQSGNYNLVYYQMDKSCSINHVIIGLIKRIVELLPRKSEVEFYRSISDDKPLTKSIENLSLDRSSEIFSQLVLFLENQNKNTLITIDNCHLCIHSGLESFEKLILDPLYHNAKTSVILSGNKKCLLPKDCRQIFLTEIDRVKYKKFIRSLFEKSGRKISPRVLNNIMTWSPGHTDLVQMICSRLWQLTKKRIKQKEFDAVLDILMDEADRYYSHVTNLLSPYQARILRSIAIQKDDFQITSSDFISKYKLNAPSSVKTALGALIEKDLIYRKGNSYFLKDVLLNNWLNYRNHCI
jgi:hypothetical protein